MEGKKLFQAAKIVNLAGKQIEAMAESLYEKLWDALESLADVGEISDGGSKYTKDNSGWLTIRYFADLAIKDKQKKKPNRHVAFQVFLFDEEKEALLPGWEPSIYVFYGPGREPFEDDSMRIAAFLEEDVKLDEDDSRLWRWHEEDEDEFDAWFFAVPLVKINNEDDLQEQIVNSVISLLEKDDPRKAFPDNSVAYSYTIEEDTISLEFAGK